MIRLLDLHIQNKIIPEKLEYDCPSGSSKNIQFLFVLALANYLGSRGRIKVTTAYQ